MSGPSNPSRVSTLADVAIPGTPANGDLLIWSSTAGPDGTGAWINKSEAAAGNVTTAVALTAHSVIIGAGGTTVKASAVGATHTLLHGNTGADPTYSGVDILNDTLANQGTTTTVLHGNAAGQPTYGAVVLTTDVSGLLPVGNGGTGVNTLTAHGVVIGNAAGAVNVTAVGTAGQVLTSNGAGLDPTFQAAAGGGLVRAPQVLTASGNYNVPAGCTKLIVKIIGAGGGGGGVASVAAQGGAAGGGASGAWVQKGYIGVVPATVVAFTIGAGGNGGVAGNNPGTLGGDTVFDTGGVLPGGATVTAKGGSGGLGDATTATAHVKSGGAGNITAGQGDIETAGQPGGAGITVVPTSGSGVISGAGGSSPWGTGGAPEIANSAGLNGSGFGSGGGGAVCENGGAAAAGGNGTNGVILVYEFT